MLYLDYLFCGILAVGALGHMVGTFKFTERGSGLFVWSLSGVLACGLLVAFNILRVQRPEDHTLAAVALVGNCAWMSIAFLFGASIKNLKDPRVLIHFVAAAGLAVFSVLSLFN